MYALKPEVKPTVTALSAKNSRELVGLGKKAAEKLPQITEVIQGIIWTPPKI